MPDDIEWVNPQIPSGDPDDRAAAEEQAALIGTVILSLAPQLMGDWGTILTLLSRNPIPPDVLRERVDLVHPKMRSLISRAWAADSAPWLSDMETG